MKKWNDPPRLFVHETTGRLVKLVWRTPKKNDPTSERHATYLTLDEVNVTGYRNILATAARWVKYRKNDVQATYPRPETVSSAYEDAREGDFIPPLRAIVYAPTCAPSGRFLKPGYDAETHLWYAADDDDPDEGDIDDEDPETLQAAIVGSRMQLTISSSSFPVTEPTPFLCSFCPLLGNLLTARSRSTISRLLSLGPARGSSLACFSGHQIRYRMIPETRREDEQEKQITAVCVNSWPAVVIDNVSNVVNSPLLASIVTSKHPELRMMGGYSMVKVRRVPDLRHHGEQSELSVRRTRAESHASASCRPSSSRASAKASGTPILRRGSKKSAPTSAAPRSRWYATGLRRVHRASRGGPGARSRRGPT